MQNIINALIIIGFINFENGGNTLTFENPNTSTFFLTLDDDNVIGFSCTSVQDGNSHDLFDQKSLWGTVDSMTIDEFIESDQLRQSFNW